MDFKNYLDRVGLLHLVGKIDEVNLNKFVEGAFSLTPKLEIEDLEKLFSYKVPKLSPDGSCSIGDDLEDKPYDLSLLFEINSKNSVWLWHLNCVIANLQQNTDVDWLGIYKKVQKDDGEVLVKVAYFGVYSRAEFPLTEEFAAHSNNSTVGLSGKVVLVKDVAEYEGPYYKCDAKVRSEFCCPILNGDGEVVGIIDAESFEKDFFDNDKILQIAKVCFELGERSQSKFKV